MATNKKEVSLGLGLITVFLVVLVSMFMPLFHGHNAMQYLDNLYNSISKGSAYHIPEAVKVAQSLQGQQIDATLSFGSEVQARRTAALLASGGAEAAATGKTVNVRGDLGGIYLAALRDADTLYHNHGTELAERYGFEERAVLYNWWAATRSISQVLTKQKRFATAKSLGAINTKALEMSYNYAGITPQQVSDEYLIVFGSLTFYVLYTLWYGFAIMFLFEGSGFRLKH